MARPLRIQYPSAFYYVTQHSNSGILLFKAEDDHKIFLSILETSIATYGVILHSFVLLKKHYHLIVETPRGNLSEFMRHLNIRYSAYYNNIHKRKGHLFGGRFKSIVFEKEVFLSSLSLYLHLNPIKVGTIKRRNKDCKREYLNSYKWSSLPGYLGKYPRYNFIHHSLILQSHGGDTPQGRSNYAEALRNQLNNGFALKSHVINQSILGSISFIEKLKGIIDPEGTPLRLLNQHIRKYLHKDQVLAELEKNLQCEQEQLLIIPGEYRSITMDMLYRYAGLSNPVIGELMDLDFTSISAGRKKLQERRFKNPQLNSQLTFLEQRFERFLSQCSDEQ